MVSKIRPGRIIMPSELRGEKPGRRLSGPTVTYRCPRGVGESTVSPPGPARKEVNMQAMNSEKFATLGPQKQQSALLELVRDGKSDSEIGDMLDMSQWQIRNLRYKLGIKKDRGGNVQVEPFTARGGDPAVSLVSLGPPGADGDSSERGLVLRVSGTYGAREVSQRLQALASLALVESGDMRYRITVSMEELPASEDEEEDVQEEEDAGSDERSQDSESSARVS